MNTELKKYIELIENYCIKNSELCFREPNGKLKYPFIVPGSAYAHDLWDWDSWLTDIAIAEVFGNDKRIVDYEKGCILNFLDHVDMQGRIPIMISENPEYRNLFDLVDGKESNIHKPCLAQHALFAKKKMIIYGLKIILMYLKDLFHIMKITLSIPADCFIG